MPTRPARYGGRPGGSCAPTISDPGDEPDPKNCPTCLEAELDKRDAQQARAKAEAEAEGMLKRGDGETIPSALDEARARAAELRETEEKPPTATAAAVDKRNGDVYFGDSGEDRPAATQDMAERVDAVAAKAGSRVSPRHGSGHLGKPPEPGSRTVARGELCGVQRRQPGDGGGGPAGSAGGQGRQCLQGPESKEKAGSVKDPCENCKITTAGTHTTRD